MKKRLIALLLVGCMVMGMVGCSGTAEEEADSESVSTEEFGNKDPESYEAELTMMVHASAQPEYMIEKFNEVYPNIKISLIEVPPADQQEKIMSAVAAGDEVPDLFTCRTQFVKAVVNGGDRYYADLNKLGDTADWSKDITDFIVDVGTDDTGALRALSWQVPVGGVYYRRSIAKEYLGTDDPEEVGKMLSTVDGVLETARTLKEKSNGSVSFMADTVTGNMYMNLFHAGGCLIDNTLNTNEEIQKIYELTKTMYDEDISAKLYNDNQGQAAAISEGKIFCMVLPTWGLNFNIMPVFPEQEGDWALTGGPYTYTSGGTYVGIYNNTEHLEECYLFMKFIFSEEFQESYAMEFGDYVSNKAVQKTVGEMDGQTDNALFNFLGHQNPYVYWNSQLEKGINADCVSPYDEFFQKYLLSSMASYADGTLTLEEALEAYKTDCQSYASSIEVE